MPLPATAVSTPIPSKCVGLLRLYLPMGTRKKWCAGYVGGVSPPENTPLPNYKKYANIWLDCSSEKKMTMQQNDKLIGKIRQNQSVSVCSMPLEASRYDRRSCNSPRDHAQKLVVAMMEGQR